MKFGIIVDGRVTEPVTVPPHREGDAEAWLAVQFPGLSGWVRVSEDAVPGATYNGNGTSTNPTIARVDAKDWTELEFRRRFTQAERIAIAAAKTQSVELADFEELLQCAGRSGARIMNTDPDLKAGLQALVDATILTADRKREILGD